MGVVWDMGTGKVFRWMETKCECGLQSVMTEDYRLANMRDTETCIWKAANKCIRENQFQGTSFLSAMLKINARMSLLFT